MIVIDCIHGQHSDNCERCEYTNEIEAVKREQLFEDGQKLSPHLINRLQNEAFAEANTLGSSLEEFEANLEAAHKAGCLVIRSFQETAKDLGKSPELLQAFDWIELEIGAITMFCSLETGLICRIGDNPAMLQEVYQELIS